MEKLDYGFRTGCMCQIISDYFFILPSIFVLVNVCTTLFIIVIGACLFTFVRQSARSSPADTMKQSKSTNCLHLIEIESSSDIYRMGWVLYRIWLDNAVALSCTSLFTFTLLMDSTSYSKTSSNYWFDTHITPTPVKINWMLAKVLAFAFRNIVRRISDDINKSQILFQIH